MAPPSVDDVSSRQADHAQQLPHVAVFPLMAMGHTMPLLDLACHLTRRKLAVVTFFTTPGNAAFVRAALQARGVGAVDDGVAVVELPFPGTGDSVAVAGESAEGVASASSFAAFVESTSRLRSGLEEALAALRPPATFLVADGFLYWAHALAAALGVPSVSFLGTSAFAHVVREAFVRDKPGAAAGEVDDKATSYYTMPEFPHVRFPLRELVPPPPVPLLQVDAKMAAAVAASHGMILNTFHDLEGRYVEHWKQHTGLKVWPVGPLCSVRRQPSVAASNKPVWMRWLDEKAATGRPVLYVALGTLASIPEAQLKEVARGLERAGVDFLWAVWPNNVDLGTEYEERVQGRGMVVREWVDQWDILRHTCVRGFLSHCGWNSVLESVTAGVPMAAWPIGFEQPINAKFVVDEIKVGVRVRTCDGTVGSFVESEEVARAITELMFGEAGMAMASDVEKIAAKAHLAVSDDGSSRKAVEAMISEFFTNNIAGKTVGAGEL